MNNMEDNLFTIGEMSKLLGISVQTLRYYDKIGLVEPTYINAETGYRYYSYIQLSFIDRIRYLQNFGMSLSEINTAFQSGNVQDLIPYLEDLLNAKMQELKKLQEHINSLHWYIDFIRYPRQQQYLGLPYKRTFETRYILAASYLPGEIPIRDSNCPSTASLELRRILGSPTFRHTAFLRKNGNLLLFQNMMHQKWEPYKYFVYLNGHPGFEHKNVICLPAGDYLCFQGKPLVDEWDTSTVTRFIHTIPDSELPALVIADEYEDKLTDFLECVYEFQIPINVTDPETNFLFQFPHDTQAENQA